jgi:FkbM family methyltransferase
LTRVFDVDETPTDRPDKTEVRSMEALQLMKSFGLGPTGIVHIGANYGQEYEEYLASAADIVVYVEPIASIFATLKARVERTPGHHAVKAVCSDRSGETIRFNVASNHGASSSMLGLGNHGKIHPEITYVAQEEMTTTTVDELLAEEFAGKRFDLMVIDVQGAELKVLEGALETLARIDAVYTEISEAPLYEGGCTWHEIDALLTSLGFAMKYMGIGRATYGNAFFLRKSVCSFWNERKLPGRTGIDIARGKPTTQSSVWGGLRPRYARAALDRMPNGSFGFHTGLDSSPWWQVDLESEMVLDEVVVFNRLDAARSRAYSFVLKLGTEDGEFREVHAQNNVPFGGIDGRPARIKLHGATARYIRIELPHEGYLHLDAVEVYALEDDDRGCAPDAPEQFVDIALQPTTDDTSATSISDQDSYRAFCKLAAKNDIVFEAFRRHPRYGLVEGMDFDSARDYIEFAKSRYPELLAANLNEFRRSDDIGGPIRYYFDEFGAFASSTTRYIKIALEMSEMFGSLDGMRIAEIGAGYGGQCRALSVLHENIESYTIFDLPEPLALAGRYLAKFAVPPLSLMDIFKAEATDYDLVISNYAFSEIEKSVQDFYLEKVISKAPRGYMIYNSEAFVHARPGFSYSSADIEKRLPSALVTPVVDMPRADQIYRNTLIYWDVSGAVREPLAPPRIDIARGKPASQSSLSPWSHRDDAQGAVNGMPSGSFSFHTGFDKNPWWQVDLESPAALHEIVVFNRLDASRDRAYSFVLKLGNEAGEFRDVHAQKGIPFGGIDGKPARIELDGAPARYVRIELPHEGFLHLDAVEVYTHPRARNGRSAGHEPR